MCGRIIVQRAKDWCTENGYDSSRIEFIFDQGDEDWGKLYRRLDIDLGVKAIERDRRKVKPLQAADWFAYEEFREVPQSDSGNRERPPRGSLQQLLRVPDDPLIYRESGMRTLCNNPVMLIPKRNEKQNQAARHLLDIKRADHIAIEIKRLKGEFSRLQNARATNIAEFDRLAHESEQVEQAYEKSISLHLSPESDAELYLTNLRFQRECWERKIALWKAMLKLLKEKAK